MVRAKTTALRYQKIIARISMPRRGGAFDAHARIEGVVEHGLNNLHCSSRIFEQGRSLRCLQAWVLVALVYRPRCAIANRSISLAALCQLAYEAF